jgi:DNA-binding NtrC family response regulator
MKVLIADDDKNLRAILRIELSAAEFEVEEAESGIKALDRLRNDAVDVLILDLNMPGLPGMEVLKEIRSLKIPVEIVILTAYATVQTAIEAMKLGAYDYLTKPFKMVQLVAVIEKAYEKKNLRQENLFLKTQIRRQNENKTIITRNPRMFAILDSLRKFALADWPVLITGESGVGKELFARALHDASPRAESPFIPINCGAIPESMLESELFGHEKGAFTGAFGKKIGLLEVANHGTLFLDEICELPDRLQVKLLRVIESGKFFRLGGTKELKVETRFVSATNKQIQNEVKKGVFRVDFYYRISGLNLNVPPLRERKEDIPLLIENVIRQNLSFKNKKFSAQALRLLSAYSWPGNVRELQNVIHRTLLLSKQDLILPEDLPADLTAECRSPVKFLEEVEKQHILEVLKDAGGHRGKAAEILGVDPKTLYRKLLAYGAQE